MNYLHNEDTILAMLRPPDAHERSAAHDFEPIRMDEKRFGKGAINHRQCVCLLPPESPRHHIGCAECAAIFAARDAR